MVGQSTGGSVIRTTGNRSTKMETSDGQVDRARKSSMGVHYIVLVVFKRKELLLMFQLEKWSD